MQGLALPLQVESRRSDTDQDGGLVQLREDNVTALKYPHDMVLPDFSPTEWAYLAGLIDGEGTVTIDRVSKGTNFTYRPSLVLVSTTPCLVDWLFDRFPCGSRHVNNSRNEAWKPQHRVAYVYRPATHLLLGMLPYLVLKRDQAEIVLNMPLSDTGRWGFTEQMRVDQRRAWVRLREIRGRIVKGPRIKQGGEECTLR